MNEIEQAVDRLLREEEVPRDASTQRSCLRCSEMFKSSGAGNRFCSKCRDNMSQLPPSSIQKSYRQRPQRPGGMTDSAVKEEDEPEIDFGAGPRPPASREGWEQRAREGLELIAIENGLELEELLGGFIATVYRTYHEWVREHPEEAANLVLAEFEPEDWEEQALNYIEAVTHPRPPNDEPDPEEYPEL